METSIEMLDNDDDWLTSSNTRDFLINASVQLLNKSKHACDSWSTTTSRESSLSISLWTRNLSTLTTLFSNKSKTTEKDLLARIILFAVHVGFWYELFLDESALPNFLFIVQLLSEHDSV